MRISQKHLQTVVDNINYFTEHKVTVVFTQGCGVYMTIDGIEQLKVKVRGEKDCYHGITNKKAYEILEPYNDEARKIVLEKYK